MVSNKKVRGEFERPIVVGSISNWLGKKGDGLTHTHRWTAYLRGMNNEDLPFIKRVVFHLHSSFKNPNRVVETPPYEISETGWGEFDLKITLHFTDPNEKSIELFHLLRLHPPEGVNTKTKHPVVSETLDTLVFKDPTESFYNLIKLPDKNQQNLSNPALQIAGDTPLTSQEQMELNKIIDSRTKVIGDIQKYRDTCKQKESEAIGLYQSIQQMEKQKLILQKKLEKYNQLQKSKIDKNNNNNNSNYNNPTPSSSALLSSANNSNILTPTNISTPSNITTPSSTSTPNLSTSIPTPMSIDSPTQNPFTPISTTTPNNN
ncbi:hypothetical protein DICPUDRAFT_150634 [Dictyostelium purpureum]|uniref:YEATS domain-containing protein n=1 Tax=Dictyostelium purpureum TaxID=5786 RepID=F0ZGU6_DICPU|nr:uncharacterized protein DICPUDRAFT_150634 [Dictyostelium purpureum]EGC36851.1 hypothetical protein DICPUDRAFT_150634 [Dictyostelium purpureum]|eukprot:XP_003286649.1 hypothetical protein DICPUDRAFT_150634 [Dictyostelium purpureum]